MTKRPADLFSVSHLFNTTLINIYAQIQTFLEFTNFQAARDKQTTNHKDKKKTFITQSYYHITSEQVDWTVLSDSLCSIKNLLRQIIGVYVRLLESENIYYWAHSCKGTAKACFSLQNIYLMYISIIIKRAQHCKQPIAQTRAQLWGNINHLENCWRI